jgi:hemolysin III
VVLRQVWLDAPKWVIAIPYIVVGWSALAVLTALFHVLGGWGFGWLMAGGLFYTAGAIAYSAKRPNPIPGVFGYHEVFHLGTVLGASCHFIVIVFFALPIAKA